MVVAGAQGGTRYGRWRANDLLPSPSLLSALFMLTAAQFCWWASGKREKREEDGERERAKKGEREPELVRPALARGAWKWLLFIRLRTATAASASAAGAPRAAARLCEPPPR